MKRIALLMALLMIFTLMFSGCAENSNPTDPTAPTTDGSGQSQPTTSGSSEPSRDHFNGYVAESFTTLDPQYNPLIVNEMIIRNIYETLLFIDDEQNIHNILAESYTISDDGFVYTFKLRPNIPFHNGEMLDADDVVYTVDRALLSPYMATSTAAIDKAEAIDDLTVAITLKYPFSPFLLYVSGIYILNKEHCEANEDISYTTCGTGAYQFVEQTEGVSLSIKSFPDYWQGEPQIKTAMWRVIPDPSTALAAFEAGEIDMASIPTSNWKSIAETGLYTAGSDDTIHIFYMLMNHEIAPFDNKLIRQVINYAINKDDIIEMARDGFALPAPTMANKYIFGATTDCVTYEFDQAKALELLAQAGYPDGFEIPEIKTLGGYFEKGAQVIQANLAEIGITTKIEICESSSFITDCMSGNYTLAMMGVQLAPDFDAFAVMYHSINIGQLNMARYNNPEVDALFDAGSKEIDRAKRQEIYKELIQIVQEDAVYVPLCNSQSAWACNKDFNYVHFMSGYFLKDCYWN